jgi:hypothetical protein
LPVYLTDCYYPSSLDYELGKIERVQVLNETAQEDLDWILHSGTIQPQKKIEKAVLKDDDKWYDLYKKALSTLGTGNYAECVMGGILEDVQVLTCDRLMGIVIEVQIREIKESATKYKIKINKMSESTWIKALVERIGL